MIFKSYLNIQNILSQFSHNAHVAALLVNQGRRVTIKEGSTSLLTCGRKFGFREMEVKVIKSSQSLLIE